MFYKTIVKILANSIFIRATTTTKTVAAAANQANNCQTDKQTKSLTVKQTYRQLDNLTKQ